MVQTHRADRRRVTSRWSVAVAVFALLNVLVLAACGSEDASPAAGSNVVGDADGIQVIDAWARPTVALARADQSDDHAHDDEHSDEHADHDEHHEHDHGSGSTGAVYVTIKNNGKAADRLVGASTEVAAVTELHHSKTVDGIAKMEQVHAIEIPAGGQVELKPGDYHLMLLDLHEDLQEGEEFSVVLTFEQAGEITTQVTVRHP